MSHVAESTTVEDLRNYAISRIYLDNFDHIKTYWPMIGRTTRTNGPGIWRRRSGRDH
ncbi:MAG: hypothetical protein R2778_04830 [Saprospiraceae bacterium]